MTEVNTIKDTAEPQKGKRISIWLDGDLDEWVSSQARLMKVGVGTVIRIRLAELFAQEQGA